MSFSRTWRSPIRAIVGLLLLSASHAALGASLPLGLVADVPLSGSTRRFDYQAFDPTTHRLFMAHLGDSTVEVFDTRRQRLAATIPSIDEVHGLLVVPALHKVFASATGRNEVDVIDARSLRVLARVSGGVYPDGLAYDPKSERVFVSDEHGGTETVIDARLGAYLATVPLGGEAGNVQYDPVSGRMLVNVQTRDDLVSIDTRTDRILDRTPLPGAQGNHGLYIEPRQHLAFIACEDNARLLVVDLGTMRVTQRFETGELPDVLAFDPELRLLYVASESGVVAVFQETGRALRLLGKAFLAHGAHTVAVDSSTHRVYFPLPDVGGKPVLRVMAPTPF